MAKKQFYVQKITPVEEVEVKPEGTEETPILVGFKVHGIKARKALAEKFEENRTDYVKLMTEVQKLEALAKTKETSGEELTEEEASKMQNLIEALYLEIDKLEAINIEVLKEDILYFKNVTATDYDQLGNRIFNEFVKDTRLVTQTDYWDDSTECLQSFISAFTDNKVWLEALKAAHTEVLSKDVKDLQVKNS